VPEVLAALSSLETRRRLERLAKKLAALRASDSPPRAIRNRRRRPLRPGWVLDAVCRVLANQATGPMRAVSVHAAVETLVGEKVSKDSVSWVLSSHSIGPSSLFVRVARGRYVLASSPPGDRMIHPSVIGPVKGPRSSSTSRRRRVVGRSTPNGRRDLASGRRWADS
jgi:hypothetical protein